MITILITNGMQAVFTKSDEPVLFAKFSERLLDARLDCRYSQIDAAAAMNMASSSTLSKLEKPSAAGRTEVPLWILANAASLYGMPVDYFLGLSNHPDGAVRITASNQQWIYDAWERLRQRDLATLDQHHKKVVELAELTGRLANLANDTYHKFENVKTLNTEEWEKLRGLHTFVEYVNELHKAADKALNAMQRLGLHKKDVRQQVTLRLISAIPVSEEAGYGTTL